MAKASRGVSKKATPKKKTKEVADVSANLQQQEPEVRPIPSVNEAPKPVTLQGKRVETKVAKAKEGVYLIREIAGKTKLIAGAIDFNLARDMQKIYPDLKIVNEKPDGKK